MSSSLETVLLRPGSSLLLLAQSRHRPDVPGQQDGAGQVRGGPHGQHVSRHPHSERDLMSISQAKHAGRLQRHQQKRRLQTGLVAGLCYIECRLLANTNNN